MADLEDALKGKRDRHSAVWLAHKMSSPSSLNESNLKTNVRRVSGNLKVDDGYGAGRAEEGRVATESSQTVQHDEVK